MSRKMIDYKVENGKITSIDGYEVGGGTAVEANPQEEATQQLDKIKIDNIAYSIAGGGSGGLGVSVIKFGPKTKNPTNQLLSWKTDDGFQELKPNTAYEVGDSFVLGYQHIISETLEENQIMSPVDAYVALSKSQTTLTYGGVILSCGPVRTSTYYTNTSAKKPTVTVSHSIIYNVVKAGTTGDNVNPPNPQTYISYIIYTLGVTQAAQ